MVGTFTLSVTDTYTEARANYVLGKVYEDLLAMYTTGLLTKATCDRWRSELFYIVSKKALKYFQFQFTKPDGTKVGLHYELKADGTISTNDKSGGIDYWSLPPGTTVYLLVDLDYGSAKISEVKEQIAEWGWGTGSALEGTSDYLKSYSKEGFGFKQSKIGQW